MAAKRLIVIVGPTAVGKTSVAIQLARSLQTEIVSADSRQVYREISIGTAKPTPAELALVRHHLVGTHSVLRPLDAAGYAAEARAVLEGLFRHHDAVVVCGGSGLYLRALLDGFDEMPAVPADVRADIGMKYRQEGLAWLQAEVQQADAAFYREVDRQNPQRLMRALELLRVSGKTMDQLRRGAGVPLPFRTVKVGLELPREALYRRIDLRVEAMMAAGLWEEAAAWANYSHLSSLQTVGYREIFSALAGAWSRDHAVGLIKQNTRRYAKRQLTWFKRDTAMTWFSPEATGAIEKFIRTQHE